MQYSLHYVENTKVWIHSTLLLKRWSDLSSGTDGPGSIPGVMPLNIFKRGLFNKYSYILILSVNSKCCLPKKSGITISMAFVVPNKSFITSNIIRTVASLPRDLQWFVYESRKKAILNGD